MLGTEVWFLADLALAVGNRLPLALEGLSDPALLPELVTVKYDVPDSLSAGSVGLDDLPNDWRRQEGLTQQRGDIWHRSRSTPLLQVPSAIVPLEGSSGRNVLINHTHPDSAAIKIASLTPFALDARLL